MSEASEVPMVCVDCGGTMTDDDAIWSPGIGVLTHFDYSQCIASLNERITAATQRAEAAEAMRDDIIAICRGTQLDDAAIHSMRGYVTEKLRIEAECEALRKVVADVRAIKKIDSPCLDGENSDWVDGWQYGYQAALKDVRECITAASPALAVQP